MGAAPQPDTPDARKPPINRHHEDAALVALLRLAARGWRLFPVVRRGKTPLLKDWPSLATMDADAIRAWWQQYPGCNWGLACGPGSGAFVVDVDGDKGGWASLRELYGKYGKDWTATVRVKTAHGYHLYFLWPEGTNIRNSAGRLAPGLDVRGDGGYVVIPPSTHPDGIAYTWNGDAPLAAAPTWLLKMIAPAAQQTAPALASNTAVLPEGERNNTLASLAGTMRRRGFTPEAIEAALLPENARRCSPPLPDSEVRAIARSVSRYPAGATQQDTPTLPEKSPRNSWPEPLREEALYGPAGEIIAMIEPHSEADPAALLIQFLVEFGGVIGRRAHCLAEADRHPCNLYAVIVGQTAKGRKGTSLGQVQRIFASVDEEWNRTRVMGGLASGEGLIWAVRDPISERAPVREHGRIVRYEDVESDAGVADKRLLVVESEFSRVLQVAERDSNTLSAIIRQA